MAPASVSHHAARVCCLGAVEDEHCRRYVHEEFPSPRALLPGHEGFALTLVWGFQLTSSQVVDPSLGRMPSDNESLLCMEIPLSHVELQHGYLDIQSLMLRSAIVPDNLGTLKWRASALAFLDDSWGANWPEAIRFFTPGSHGSRAIAPHPSAYSPPAMMPSLKPSAALCRLKPAPSLLTLRRSSGVRRRPTWLSLPVASRGVGRCEATPSLR